MPEATDMQLMEMDMVQGMYDSYQLHSTNPPIYSIVLSASADDPAELKVTITYPNEDYPEFASCNVTVESISKKRRIQTANLTKEIETTCTENIGVHVVVLLLQQIQNFLTSNAEEAEKVELVRRGETLNRVGAQNNLITHDPTITVGTAVTKELFEEWSRKHYAEKEKENFRAERSRKDATHSGNTNVPGPLVKLTGRQIWDTTLKDAQWQLFDGLEDGAEDVQFGNFDTLNEDDFDFDDQV